MNLWKLTVLAALLCHCTRAEASVFDDLASPITVPPARTTLLIGASITTLLLVFEDSIVDQAQREAVEHRPLGKFSKVGDYGGKLVPNAAYAGGMFLSGIFGERDGFRNAKTMFLATLYAASVTSLLKVTVREPRPNDGSDRKSFPSGHATTAFAFAAVVGAEHSLAWGVPAYALAGLVAYSRMNDNKHYLHDVFAGATIGMAYGLGIHRLKRKRSPISFAPLWDEEKKGLVLAYEF